MTLMVNDRSPRRRRALRPAIVVFAALSLAGVGCSNSNDASPVSVVPIGTDSAGNPVSAGSVAGSTPVAGGGGEATVGDDQSAPNDAGNGATGSADGAVQAGANAEDEVPGSAPTAQTPNSFNIEVPAQTEGENSLQIVENDGKSTVIVKDAADKVIFERTYDNADPEYLDLVQFPEDREGDPAAGEVVVVDENGAELVRIPLLDVLNAKNQLVQNG